MDNQLAKHCIQKTSYMYTVELKINELLNKGLLSPPSLSCYNFIILATNFNISCALESGGQTSKAKGNMLLKFLKSGMDACN